MSNKRIGCENFGKFYTEGKVRNRREWRGVTDTLYDYSRWLHNWITMAKMVSKPRNIKAMFRYRWMANYLAVPMMVDRHTQGLRDEYLRICHLEQDLIIEDVAKLLDGLFRGDRRIGKDKKFSDKVVLVDENEMTAVMMGFPTLKGLSRETPSTYVSVLLNQHAAEHYIDVAQEYGLAGDVCPMPEAEAGVSIDDDAPVLGACAVQCNTTCDGSLLGNGVISKRLELEDGIPVFQLAAPLRHREDDVQEYAAQDEATKRQLAEERSAQAMEEFGDLDTENSASVSSGNASDENWQDALEIDKQGRVKDTLGNLALILRNDPKLKDIAYNIHRSGIDIRRDADGKTTLPWTQLKPGWNESDLGAIQIYLERVYNLYTPSKLKSILLAIAAERSYHPVRDYIESLPAWDGVPRVDTLFIDYLGSPDTLYIRAIARKMMVAAVARIYEPGIKFDSVVVLNGPQGMGKSSFFAKLGGKWFSDSLTISDMKDKAAPEKLQGYWILELGELAGLKKMDVETVKAFITRQGR